MDTELVAILHPENSSSSSSMPASVMSGGSQRSVLGQMLFNILINYINSGIECTLIMCADHTELYGVVNMPEGQDIIQDLDKLKQWSWKNLCCASIIHQQ